MPDIVIRRTASLTPQERADIGRVLVEAFEVLVPVQQVTDSYCATMPSVLLGYERGALVGFQFYRHLEVDGAYVCQFSLAARMPGDAASGLQRRFGFRLMRESLGRLLNPFRTIAIVGVSNNPKTYRNMFLMGGRVFPDVTRPGDVYPYRRLYERVAEQLNITGLDVATGLVRDRCGSLGLRMRQSAFEQRRDPINEGFMRLVDGDANHGILTMAVASPLTAVTSVMTRRLRGSTREARPC